MILNRQNIIAVLDIGSAKIVCTVAKVLSDGNVQILGYGYCASRGIRAGVITDIELARSSIMKAKAAAEMSSGERIKRVHVSLPSSILLSQRITSSITVAGREINYKDINKMLLDALVKYDKQPLEVIHSFIFDYMLDGNRGILNPLGMYGHHLACEMHVLTIPSNLLLNIFNCISGCQLEIENYISSSYCSGLSVLTDDEMHIGVTLIEFGAGATSISCFENNQMIFTDGVALGGANITSDVAKSFGTSFINAERIKNLYGALILTSNDSREAIEVPLTDDRDSEVNIVNRSMLIDIIRAKIEEIVELLILKLEENKIPISNKIVITGGGANLSGLKELLSHLLGVKVRIGIPKLQSGFNKDADKLDFVNASGMLKHIVSELQKNTNFSEGKKTAYRSIGNMRGVMNWIKNNFLS